MNRLLLAFLLATTSLAHAVSLEEFLTKRGYTAVPIRVSVPHHYIVDGKVNGRKAAIMVDTGAVRVLVDQTLAAGLKPIETPVPEKHMGAFGPFTVSGAEVMLEALQIGPLRFAERASVIKLHKPVTYVGSRIPRTGTLQEWDVIIGWEFLSHHHAIIDAAQLKLYLRDTEPPADLANTFGRSLLSGGFELIPLVSRESKIEVDGFINGHPALFLIDTGAGVTAVDLSQAEALGIEVREKVLESVDVGGNRESTMLGIVGVLQVGKYEWNKMAVTLIKLQFFNADRKQEDWPPHQGFLGTEFLARARGIIDCANLRLYLHSGK